MKQERRLAIIKASIQSLEERYPDLDWKAFKKDKDGLKSKPLTKEVTRLSNKYPEAR